MHPLQIYSKTDSRFKSVVKPIKWNSSVSLGEKVFTLGYPISNKMSDNVKVVDGIVSGLNGREGNKAFFQTTLPVWYGNSGGPCFNSKGEIFIQDLFTTFKDGVIINLNDTNLIVDDGWSL